MKHVDGRDMHGTENTTRWIHKHRTAAKWMIKALTLGMTSVLYYLKQEEKEIEKEEKNADK